MITLKIRTTGDDIETIKVAELLEINGKPLSELTNPTVVDPRTLENRLTVLEEAVAHYASQWNEFIATAEIVRPETEGV